jgi:DNA helicase-2/ATP-dependent DNA helicase PcrA
MGDGLERLNPHQRAAVLDTSPVCLVNAQVGSGKTTVLIAKILHLYQTGGVPLRDMVVLTFTNKAAGEIRERMREADTGLTEADMPWFGTFHGVALRMLQELLPVEKVGYHPGFSVIDPDELHAMAAGLIVEHGLNVRYPNSLQNRIEAWRVGRSLYGNMKKPDDMGRLWELLQEKKRAANRMDFDDLIAHCTVLLRERPRPYAPRWILLDEFQDSDAKLLDFVEALRTEETRLFAVGDPNQVIYSWRGSDIHVFRDFAKETQATVLSLPVNYRSTGTILDAARSLLGDASVLDGVREPGGAIRLRRHHNPFNEAEYLAKTIHLLREEGTPYRDIAVLYRLQRQADVLGDVFVRAGIPYLVSMRKTLKDLPVAQWTVRLLHAAANPADIGSVTAVLMDTAYGASLTRSEIRTLLATDREQRETPGGSGSILFDRIRGFRDWARGREGAEEVYAYFGLDGHLQPTSTRFEENRRRVEGLLGKLDRFVRQKGMDLAAGTSAFLDAVALHGIDVVDEETPTDADAVRLMTLHACKGLEFRYVFIVGANQGLIPLGSSTDEAEREEEKRLFFVGITRARDHLEISYCASPEEMRVLPEPSEYLAAIPARLIAADEGEGSAEVEPASPGTIPGEVDFRSLRREVRDRIVRRDTESDSGKEEPSAMETSAAPVPDRHVRHARYGIGTVASEDDETITVAFEGYGEKSFTKAFAQLEEV